MSLVPEPQTLHFWQLTALATFNIGLGWLLGRRDAKQ